MTRSEASSYIHFQDQLSAAGIKQAERRMSFDSIIILTNPTAGFQVVSYMFTYSIGTYGQPSI
jgi:hypothetical protein